VNFRMDTERPCPSVFYLECIHSVIQIYEFNNTSLRVLRIESVEIYHTVMVIRFSITCVYPETNGDIEARQGSHSERRNNSKSEIKQLKNIDKHDQTFNVSHLDVEIPGLVAI
jgi:hypothetical protein